MSVPAASTWLLTRDGEDSAADAEQLAKASVPWASVPCIEYVTRPWPQWPVHAGTPVLFVSSRRAAAAVPPGQALWAGEPEGLIAATAPSTSKWLEAHGHPVDFWAHGGAEGLARTLVAAWQAMGRPEWNVRYPTSDAGLAAPEQEHAVALLKTLGPVDRELVYETRPAGGLSEKLAPLMGKPFSVSFSSPSAVKAFLEAVPRDARAADRVACFGASTVRAWDVARPKGWPAAEAAEPSVVEWIIRSTQEK